MYLVPLVSPGERPTSFGLQVIRDEYREQVHSACTCLIAARIKASFCLPLIEAARHGIPIVARDIPVFCEVTGDCAFYSSGDTLRGLATALKTWLGAEIPIQRMSERKALPNSFRSSLKTEPTSILVPTPSQPKQNQSLFGNIFN
jgi:glycosyltransferase involved in cell wall biosynthesis